MTWSYGKLTSTIGVLIVVLIASVAPSSAGTSDDAPARTKKRTVYMSYNYVRSSNDNPLEYNALEPVEVEVEAKERWAAITVHDASGRPTGAEVGQDTDGDGTLDKTWEVCGSSDRPVRIRPRKTLYITVLYEPCSDEAGLATTGDVQVDLFSPARRRPGSSTPRVERLENISYTAPGYYETTSGFGVNGVRMETMPGEAYLKVESADASGLPVRIQIFPGDAPTIEICGRTDEAVAFPERAELTVRVFEGPCEDGTPAAATSGSIELTLSNHP